MPRGLGSKIGEEKQVEAELRMKKKNEYAENLRKMNKKFGLMSVGAKTKEIGSAPYVPTAIAKQELK